MTTMHKMATTTTTAATAITSKGDPALASDAFAFDPAEQAGMKLFVRGTVRKYEALIRAQAADVGCSSRVSIETGARLNFRELRDRWEGHKGPLNVRDSSTSTNQPSVRQPSRFDVYELAFGAVGTDTDTYDDHDDLTAPQESETQESPVEQAAQDPRDTQDQEQDEDEDAQDQDAPVKLVDHNDDDKAEVTVDEVLMANVVEVVAEVKAVDATEQPVENADTQDQLKSTPAMDTVPTTIEDVTPETESNAEAETKTKPESEPESMAASESETEPEAEAEAEAEHDLKQATIAWISWTSVWLLAMARQLLVFLVWGNMAVMLTEVVAVVVAIAVVVRVFLGFIFRGLVSARRVCIVCTPLILALVRGGSVGAKWCARCGMFTLTKTWACARIAYPHVMAAWRWATGTFRAIVQATATSLKQWSHELWFWLEVAFVATWLLWVIVVQLYRSNRNVTASAKIKTQQGYAVKPVEAFLEKPCARDAGCGNETSETESDTSSDVESDDGMEIEVEIEMETKIEIEIDIQTGPPTQTEMKTVNEVKTDLARLPQPPTPVQTADTGSTNANAEPKPKEGESESESESESETDVHVEVVPVALPSDQHAALGRETHPIDTVVRSTLSAASVSVCADVVEATIQMGEASVELLSDSTLVPMSMSAVALFSSPVVGEAPAPSVYTSTSTPTTTLKSVCNESSLVSDSASVWASRSRSLADMSNTSAVGSASTVRGADVVIDASVPGAADRAAAPTQAPAPTAVATPVPVAVAVAAPEEAATAAEATEVETAPQGVTVANRATRASASPALPTSDSVSPAAPAFLRRGVVKKVKKVKSVVPVKSKYLDYPDSVYYQNNLKTSKAIRDALALASDSTDGGRWK